MNKNSIITDELITVCSQDTPSIIQKIPNNIPDQELSIKRIQSDVAPQMQEMEDLLCKLLCAQLFSIGFIKEKKFVKTELKAEIGLIDLYDGWLEESIAVLERKSYLYRDGNSYTVNVVPPDVDAVWHEWDKEKGRWLNNPDLKSHVALVKSTMQALPDILTGKQLATDVIFPNSSMKLVSGIYKNNLVADYFNGVLADSVLSYIQEIVKQNASALVRILEIGAGTGGTSQLVFAKLRAYQSHIQEYCYTDISKAFLIQAEKEFGADNSYLTYKTFNVEAQISGQGIDAGTYDIVIAANVLHATRNIRQTLRNAKAALKKNGLIVLNEISNNSIFIHLTFGLLKGWWIYEDPALRIEGCPGLSSDSWQRVLETEGFRTVLFLAEDGHNLGQQIILAESDGVVRQKQEFQANLKKVRPNVEVNKLRTSKQEPQKICVGTSPSSSSLLREKSTVFIQNLISQSLKIPSSKLESSQPLAKYGIDSIMVVQLSSTFSKVFNEIPITLFFECQTIDALVEHFLKTQKQALIKLVGLEDHQSNRKISDDNKTLVQSKASLSNLTNVKPERFLQLNSRKEMKIEAQPIPVQDVAIIGLSGRYPGAKNINELWINLREGIDCITEIPRERWDHSMYFGKTNNDTGKTFCKWGGFIDDVDQFDPLFFNIPPVEAEIMDPQERLFLECVWELLEGAGYTRETLQRQFQAEVGVFVGAGYQQYRLFKSDILKESIVSLSSHSSIANRVSYFFNFQGPSIAMDTMCSSSNIAIHMARESLLRGECQLAIAGGVNLSIHPKKYLGLAETGLLGSNVNSRSFADGDGYLPAEGVGAVLLKPLSKAIQDGDSILAIIKSTAINHGGHTNGYTVPDPGAQARLIENNFKKSGIDPRTISYVEAASNGSALGDPIELAGLNKAFRKFTTDSNFCAIGSVKSNIGHGEAISGISQLTKVVLQLQHKQLVPSIKTKPQNPNIDFSNTPFYLQEELQEWKRPVVKLSNEEKEFPRRATISSFGAGGSNAHIIVEEYTSPEVERPEFNSTTEPQIVVLSARNLDRLQAVVQQILEFVNIQKDFSLPDFAYTLQVGREPMDYRVAVVVSNKGELYQGLKQYLQSIKKDYADKKEFTEESSIPIFSGGPETEHSEIRKLLTGKTEETLLQVLLAEKNLEKLAFYWVIGAKIPWELLYEGKTVRKISLPTYPFEKRRCWIDSEQDTPLILESNKSKDCSTGTTTIHSTLKDQVIDIMSHTLGLTPSEVKLDESLDQYGLNSIILLQLFQKLRTQVDPSISLDKLQACNTMQDILNLVNRQNIDTPILVEKLRTISHRTTWPQFPELIQLNQSSEGRPVFWIHGGLGGVEVYQVLAQISQRPFYGIQARGWMTNRAPLQGIQAMAAYYIHIIQSVQQEGPYDLGGYSLGGILAYEIARQLQEMGQTVKTIVMVDAMYSDELKKVQASQKTVILQAVNMALFNPKRSEALIHREEVNSNLEDEAFTKQLVKLAKTREPSNKEKLLHTQIQQMIKVHKLYELGNYDVLPLPAPNIITCYYFRNKKGLFFGELEPYFIMEEDKFDLDHKNYWKEWERNIPNIHMIDVDCSNHMTILTEPDSQGTVIEFCKTLYSA